MIEIDGSLTAWFEDHDGTKHVYEVYGIGSKHAGDLVQAYALWRKGVEDPTKILVWRRRPEITLQTDEVIEDFEGQPIPNPLPEPWWKLTYRFVIVPIDDGCMITPLLKLEGRDVAKIIRYR